MLTLESFGLNIHDLHCPKCGTKIVQMQGDEAEIVECPHLLFVATDDAFEFATDQVIASYQELQQYNDVVDIDVFTSGLAVADGMKFSMMIPAPALLSAYAGFDFSVK
jgi:hypothetical protein